MSKEKSRECIDLAVKQLALNFQLKDKQIETICSVLLGTDTLAILPTGYGKSLIYMLLPICQDNFHGTQPGEHKVIVISPLVALMEEQMAKINTYGVSAAYVGSSETEAGNLAIFFAQFSRSPYSLHRLNGEEDSKRF